MPRLPSASCRVRFPAAAGRTGLAGAAGRTRLTVALRAQVTVVLASVLALAGCAATEDPGAPTQTPPAATGTAAGALPDEVATGLLSPWGLAFLPDGSALVTVRDTGEVLRVRRGAAPESLGVVPGVRHGGEGGLLGIAVSPDFDQDRAVFVYLTTSQDNRVLRMRLRSEAPEELVQDRAIITGIPRAGNHNGGRLAVGPDGFLYVTTGDAGNPRNAQDLSSLAGKILRVTFDGEAAPGNPRSGSPVWSWGHRNVQGLAWDARGRMFASEFGQSTWDELNLIVPGGNYGWPAVEGVPDDGDSGEEFLEPLLVWRPADASPSGIAIQGEAVYLAALRGESLWRVPLLGGSGGPGTADAVVGEPERLLQGEYGRFRAVEVDDDGSLWLVTSNTTRGRVRPGDDRVVVVDPTVLR